MRPCNDLARWGRLSPRQQQQRYWRNRQAQWQRAVMTALLAGVTPSDALAAALGLAGDAEGTLAGRRRGLGRISGRQSWNATSWGGPWSAWSPAGRPLGGLARVLPTTPSGQLE